MTRKEKIFKVLSLKHCLDVLAHIYQNSEISFADICKGFPNESVHTIRKLTNKLSSVGLIKSIYVKDSQDKRKKGYIICDENAVITFLELDI